MAPPYAGCSRGGKTNLVITTRAVRTHWPMAERGIGHQRLEIYPPAGNSSALQLAGYPMPIVRVSRSERAELRSPNVSWNPVASAILMRLLRLGSCLPPSHRATVG